MNHTALVSFLLVFPFLVSGQNANFSMDVSQLRAETVYFPIEGSPYYDDTYRIGQVNFKGELYTLFFRFNALEDRIELKDRTKRLFHMQKNEILEPTFAGRTYRYKFYYEEGELKRGYLVPLTRGKVTLYHKPRKVFVQAQSPENGYHSFRSPHYKDVSAYYLQFGNELPKPVKLGRKYLLNALNGMEANLKEYIREQELDLRQEKDVIKLLEFYNRIG